MLPVDGSTPTSGCPRRPPGFGLLNPWKKLTAPPRLRVAVVNVGAEVPVCASVDLATKKLDVLLNDVPPT